MNKVSKQQKIRGKVFCEFNGWIFRTNIAMVIKYWYATVQLSIKKNQKSIFRYQIVINSVFALTKIVFFMSSLNQSQYLAAKPDTVKN